MTTGGGGGGSLLPRPAPESVRRIALAFLDAAAAASRRLEVSEAGSTADPEALHDFRVAVRRLRSTLRAYRPVLGTAIRRKDERALRALTRATGAGRDAEVGRAWLAAGRESLGPEARAVADRVGDALEAETVSGYEAAREAAGVAFRRLERRLRRRLRCVASLDASSASGPVAVRSFAAAFDRILPAVVAALDAALDAVGSLEDRREAHRARIRGKRVRYLLEPLADEVEGASELVDRLKGLQDAVGDLRDLQLLEERVTALGAGPGADPLLDRIREEQAARFGDLARAWLGGEERDGFFAELETLRRRVAAAAPDAIEIERKYLLSGRPGGLEGVRARELEQGYLPGERIQERLRRIRDGDAVRHVRSIKLGAGVVRTEVQEEIDPGLFERLWPLTEGRRVAKRRYAAHGGGLLWEIDEFTDRELWLAEVEIPSAGYEPEIPAWLAPYIVREVTDEPAYLNVHLAR